jgi:hypothetical protein
LAACPPHGGGDSIVIPIDFVLFALTLLGVAVFHHHTLRVALFGLTAITIYEVVASPFREGAGLCWRRR